jgi:hypothetical protein
VDDRLRAFWQVFASGAFFGVLGAAFGALVGHLSWTRGRPAGSAAGLAVARALARVSEREATPGRSGLVVGAVDGFLFLGLLGTVFGLLITARGSADWAVLSRPAVGALLLTGGAVFFGGLALAIIHAGGKAVIGVFAGGMVGAVSGAFFARADGIIIGAVGGVLAGTVLGVARRGRR